LDNSARALILGDVIGQSGCRALFYKIKEMKKQYAADLIIVNGENAAGGFGITPDIFDQFIRAGVDAVTSGNHIWQKHEINEYLDSKAALLRPANYPAGVPGHGYCIIEVKGRKLAVVNLQGRLRMQNLNCPFLSAKELLKKINAETKTVFVDFHAEDTEEKEALGHYLAGKVTCVYGTHTHVQTSDEKILAGSTAYITDIGMVGPAGSVIGSKKDIAIERTLTQMPLKMETDEAPAALEGILVEFDPVSGKALSIQSIREKAAY
jgi:hypothetical protein